VWQVGCGVWNAELPAGEPQHPQDWSCLGGEAHGIVGCMSALRRRRAAYGRAQPCQPDADVTRLPL